jgi:hypothetical protein
MAATILRGNSMEIDSLVQKLESAFPQFTFTASKQACWSPETRQVHYSANSDVQTAAWSLLHELGHALLNHKSYNTDVDLLQKEVAAWTKAANIASDFNITIEEEYAQNCLETYRNWLYKRSTCPECGTHGIQSEGRQYYCLNCTARWNVSISRFCRPYRGKAEKEKLAKSQEDNSWLFVGAAPS